ncbi:MAG: sigma-54-dependent Fis family transcriptional regulator [Bacteroidales bacterium]|nr:sigma-54-dependent Fis family transcriptional regulator [Bacteroidales bacterium]
MKKLILIIDDDPNYTSDIKLLLKKSFNTISAETIREAMALIQSESPNLILLDLMLRNGESGLSAIDLIKMEDENMPIIMVTDYSSVETAIKAIKKGAYNYVSKTSKIADLVIQINKAIEHRGMVLGATALNEYVDRDFKDIIGESQIMKMLKEQIKLFADNNSTLLIYGESGTGKELVTRHIHKQSSRADKPFIAVNCAAIPKDLLESELFGHEKGAFTGAHSRKLGKFEQASDGTLFLDEIGELDQKAQVTLLRVLQEKEFNRVGGSSLIKTDARIIAATNRKLEDLVRSGVFREDLYYRLEILKIDVPPLRERKNDIPMLVKHFVKVASQEAKVPIKNFAEESLDLFTEYDWPGNIRELYNFIMRAVVMSQFSDEILLNIPDRQKLGDSNFLYSADTSMESWQDMIDERKKAADKASRQVEKYFINEILKKYNNNITFASNRLGIDRTTLHKTIKRVKDDNKQ